MRLKDKVAIITGSASGIGAATARLFAREGASIVVSDIAPTRPVVDAITAAGGNAIGLEGDVSQSPVVAKLIDTTVSTFGKLDIFVSNAGAHTLPKPIDQTTEDEWDRILAVNLTAGFLCIKHAIPHLRKTRGVILLTASIAGLEGVKGLGAYAVTKAAVINMGRTAALDYASDGIRVNVMCPGATATPMLKASEIPMDLIAQALPLRKLIPPEEIAEGFCYLASAAASSITGHVLTIDAGWTAGDFVLDTLKPAT